LLPKPNKPGRPPTWSKRQLIDSIRLRVGAPWGDVPTGYGALRTVYGLFADLETGQYWRRRTATAMRPATQMTRATRPAITRRAPTSASGRKRHGPATGSMDGVPVGST
jgi:hypothetical protein